MRLLKDGERHRVRFVLNGEPVEGLAEPRMLLTDFIRHEIGATGTHVGCEHGICGACTIRLDGRAVRACLMLAVQAEGKRIETVEGLAAPDAPLSTLQLAFHRNFALQCGYCTPGFLMTLTDFLERNPEPIRSGDPSGAERQPMPMHRLCRDRGCCPRSRARNARATHAQSRRLQVRALVVREFGPISSHHIEEVPDPVAGEHDVLIEVKAIGLNFPDTLMLQGKYQTRPDRPFVPGRDASGVVVAVGRNVSRVKTGDRVIAQVTTGAFAEKLAAPQARCFRIPDGLDFVSAAGMVTIYNTAYVAVVIRGQVKRGETVLVTGASGGVGLATVQVAKAKGARVLAGVTSKEKGQVALASGADALIDLSAADLRESLRQQVFALTDNRGVDAVFDPVGGDVFDAALRAVAYAGRMVIIGFASGRIPEVKGHYVLLKNIAVVGAPLDIHFKMEPQVMDAAVADLFRMYERGEIKPEIMAIYPLGEIHKAMDLDRRTPGQRQDRSDHKCGMRPASRSSTSDRSSEDCCGCRA